MTQVSCPSTPWSVTEIGPASAVDTAEWTTVSTGHALCSSAEWIRHADTIPDARARHLVLYEGARPVAALPTYAFERTRPYYFYDPDAILGAGGAAGQPVCLAGTRLGRTSEFLTGGLSDPARRSQAAGALLDAFRARCRERQATGAMLYVPDDSLDLVLTELAPEDEVVLLNATAVLDVPAGGLDNYREMVGKGRWSQFRREMRRFEKEGCERQVLPLGAHLEEMAALALQVSLRYGHDMTLQAEIDKLRLQAERLSDCIVMAAFRDGEMVGFNQFFLNGRTMVATGHGVAEEYGRKASIYFNLMYYEPIRWAADHGFERINLSTDTLEAKVWRGGRLHALWALVIAPRWSDDEKRAVREKEQALLRRLRTIDERIVTPTMRAVAKRQGWDGFPDGSATWPEERSRQ